MPDFTVSRYGTDSSGRPIYLTSYMAAWWDGVVERLGFTPTIVQGAFMAQVDGGGADASAGYHDLGGCIDLRVWDLTGDKQGQLVRECRRSGAAAWIRDEARGGMDPHLHLVLGTDQPLADGAAWQWQQYLDGHDGLSSGGRDYHWRPDPLITEPPEVDDMADYAAQLNRIEKSLDTFRDREAERDKAELARAKARHEAILALLDKLADDISDAPSKAQVRRLRVAVEALADPGPTP